MPETNSIYLIVLGLIAGFFSGMLGIGGATIIIPSLVLLFGFSQHMAQGTTLAMFSLPIGLLGAVTYYRHGHVKISIVLMLCSGFVLGALAGSNVAEYMSEQTLKRIFGLLMLVISIKFLLAK